MKWFIEKRSQAAEGNPLFEHYFLLWIYFLWLVTTKIEVGLWPKINFQALFIMLKWTKDLNICKV